MTNKFSNKKPVTVGGDGVKLKANSQSHHRTLSDEDVDNIAKSLGKAHKTDKGWKCCCPAHDDHDPSLSISLSADGKLLVHCFTGCTFEAILKEIRNRGLLLPNNRNQFSILTTPKVAKAPKVVKNTTPDIIHKIWSECHEANRSKVTHYLQSRGITCTLPGAIREHSNLYHKPSNSYHPAMVAAVTVWTNETIVGLHRTYLKHDGSGKADVTPNKMMLGSVTEGAIRIGDNLEVIAYC